MALSLVTAPTADAITLAEAKLHLRAEDTDDDDALIESLILAAIDYVENFTQRALVTQTWDLKLDAFPCDGDEPIVLPKPPVSAVSSITYIAADGTSTTWSSNLYTTDLPTGVVAAPARIVPAYGQYYPVTRDVINAVTVRFVCGYGTPEQVPQGIKAAIKILIATWFSPGRQAVQIGNIVTPIPMTVDSLLWPFKAFAC